METVIAVVIFVVVAAVVVWKFRRPLTDKVRGVKEKIGGWKRGAPDQ